MSLLDQNKRPVPVCNVWDEQAGLRLFVPQQESFLQDRKKLQNSQIVVLITATVLILVMCILTMNLNAAGWTAGNLLTFLVGVGILYVLVTYTKKWMVAQASIAEVTKTGTPCIYPEGNNNIVYCGRNNNNSIAQIWPF